MLTIAVSSRSLFNIEDGHQVFEEQGQEAFDKYMEEKEHVPLRPGPAFRLVGKLLSLNKGMGAARDKVDVVLLSRNSLSGGLRIMNSIYHYNLDIERAAFTSGSDRFKYAKALGAHLFLSANASDVQAALNKNMAAAMMIPSEQEYDENDKEVRIAFDGDAVIFDDEADKEYKQNGLEGFRTHELTKAGIPLNPGPLKLFLDELGGIQRMYSDPKNCPLKIALVTARGLPAHARVVHTLKQWGLHLDEGIFAGGLKKGPLLQAFGADIFFDDTLKNIDSANEHDIPSAHVPYGSGQGITRM